MNWKQILLTSIAILFIAFSTVVYIYRDKIVYVGSIEIVEIECSQQKEILDQVLISDQLIRKPGIPFKKFATENHRNQELVISILKKCGMPTSGEVSKKQLATIWLILQHSTKEYRKEYFPEVENAMKNGDLTKEQYALMKDRILMDEGEPQIYGTQLQNGKLYKLDAPQTVNERRKEMGLAPLETYLRQFNIEFKPE